VDIISALLRQAHPGLQLERRIIKTSGDMFQTVSLTKGDGKGLFTKEIEEQLLAGQIDVAIHSLKDLPTTLPDGLCLGASPTREDVRDVLISKQPMSVATLPAGATIATSSIRRRAQLLAARPDLNVVEIRGNVDTRLRKLGENTDWAATILACAGLNRLGIRPNWPQYHWQPLPVEVMLPAVGQGAIACEIRTNDAGTRALLAKVNDAATFASVTAERSFLHAIGGGCQLPYAAHGTVTGDELRLVAAMFSEDGKTVKRSTVTGKVMEATALGRQAAERLLVASPGVR
jgi:hydroxymethylbilane synthase